MYTTPAALLARFGAEELAQVATPREFARAPTALLRAVIAGEDVTSYPADEIEAANAAHGRMLVAAEDAENDINFYIGARFSLPLEPVPSTLVRVASDIARYRLYEDHAPEEVRDRYKDSLRLLEQIAQGKINLGVDTPDTSAGEPDFFAPPRVFGPDTLTDF